jgi:hypothetical protein
MGKLNPHAPPQAEINDDATEPPRRKYLARNQRPCAFSGVASTACA